ncbi:hypothetical protein Vretimale_11620 [Volvox reticuliferus]|uniref:O-fucosyltransferase family protein n=2 Tax=Volvox reticuliferus TaxID=1737510 RepID=A0A8J4GGY1_9CHLO|nr:hypothetical protein Vretimale_11620 [Volvox reticuliferus]
MAHSASCASARFCMFQAISPNKPGTSRRLQQLLLILLALLGPAVPVATALDTGSLPGCAAWVSEYAAFHKATRLAPDAKYILHTCYSGMCGGVGDRLRGVLWSVRLAIATQRVILVSWHRPLELTNYFQPGEIDWTLEGIPKVSLDSKQRLGWLDSVPSAHMLASLQPDRVVWELEHNTLEDAPVAAGAPELPLWSDTAACLFQALFQPNELVMSAVEAEIASLYGNSQAPYSALHIRIGGLEGEGEASIQLSRMSKLNYFLESVSCLHDLSQTGIGGQDSQETAAVRQPAHLVVSDSNFLRNKIRKGVLPGLVAPSYTSTHLDTVHNSNVMVGGCISDWLSGWVGGFVPILKHYAL